MSLQRIVLGLLIGSRVKPLTADGLDVERLRANDRPVPPGKRTWGCTYQSAQLDGVRVTFVQPASIRSSRVLVHFHGGIYVAGIGEPHWWLLSRLCQETGSLGVMVDYRLAPEHPFPAALEDALAALAILAAEHGAANLIVSGDSAGGGLALASAMKRRDDGADLPGKLVLLSPWLDITLDHPDVAAQEPLDRMLGRRGLVEGGKWYADKEDPRLPYLSPAYGNLNGLPPTLVQIGTHEVLLPDARALHDRAKADGFDLTYREYPKLFHVWTLFFPILPEGETAVREILEFIC